MFRRSKKYSRWVELEAASKALSRRRTRRAIRHFRAILEHEPDDLGTHLKIAPLLARAKEPEEAWRHFVAAAEGFEEKGFADKVLSVYKQTTSLLPHYEVGWERLADLELERRGPTEAVLVLREGAQVFHARRRRPIAVILLRKAVRIAPGDFEAAFELGCELGRVGRSGEAVTLLERLARGGSGPRLQRLRARLFLIQPTPVRAWQWIHAKLTNR